MDTVLTIAGFDPSSGAGVTADLAVFAAHGLFGVSAITALTVQSTVGVRSSHAVDGGLLRDTLVTLEDDLPAKGIKIGMLGTAECVAAVADFLEELHRVGRRPVVVLDPVLRSSSGRVLLEDTGVDLLRDRLLPLVDWATPNVDELGVLIQSGGDDARAQAFEAVAGYADELQRRCPSLGLVVTGGDLDPPNDLFLAPSAVRGGHVSEPLRGVWLAGERVQTSATHGTGCAFSSAMLSRLMLGDEPFDAARAAKGYVAEAMRRAMPLGRGHGPMHLLWPLREKLGETTDARLWQAKM